MDIWVRRAAALEVQGITRIFSQIEMEKVCSCG
jgi:hypothetical protein